MNNFEEHFNSLKSAVTYQKFQIQIAIISQLINCIEQSTDKIGVVQEILKTNLGTTLNDVISTQITILMPTVKLIRHLMKDFHFRNYQFIHTFKNILRMLILLVQNNKIEKCQLEFFEIVNNLDVLLKMYLCKDSPQKEDEDLQTIFVCLLKFIELVNNCEKIFAIAIKHLMMEIYLNLLSLIETNSCIFKNFELIMKVSRLADVFLDYLFEKYRKEGGELWLFKTIEILFRLLKSCNYSDTLQVKCFENIFYGRLSFVLEQTMILNSSKRNTELFKFYISMLNTILWTPSFSKNFCTKILKKVVKLKADSIIFALSKSSRKIRQYTQYSMKIFLTSFVVHSGGFSVKTHVILNTFLQTRLPNSIIDMRSSEILKNSKVLILLYGCSFFKQYLRESLNANRVLENLAIILQTSGDNIDDEIWKILRIFAYFSRYAFLSALEYAGIQQISESLLTKASDFCIDKQRLIYPINKNIILFAEKFAPNSKILNTMILSYLSQAPSLTNSKIGQIIPSSQILPFICSIDYNQVVNSVMIIQKKHLKEEDLDFIVREGFRSSNCEEIHIEGVLNIIDKHQKIISACSATQVLTGTIAFLQAKQKSSKFSTQCYFLMMKTCVNLVRFAPNVNFKFEEFCSKSNIF